MKIIWNIAEACFEVQFHDFNVDLEAVKKAGFRTTGPPEWKWYTDKISPLDKLRKNRPASGLSIMQDALDQYTRLKEQDDKKKALLAELKEAKKGEPKRAEKGYTVLCEEGFGYMPVEPSDPTKLPYTPPVWTGPICRICSSPVYFYEDQKNKICLYCELQLDNAPDLF
jgi:hypothetical protein